MIDGLAFIQSACRDVDVCIAMEMWQVFKLILPSGIIPIGPRKVFPLVRVRVKFSQCSFTNLDVSSYFEF